MDGSQRRGIGSRYRPPSVHRDSHDFSRSVHQDVILLYLSGERSPVADRALRFNIWEAMSLHGLLLYLAHLLSFPWSPSIHRLQPGSCLLIVQHADTLCRKRTSTGGGGSRRLITIIC